MLSESARWRSRTRLYKDLQDAYVSTVRSSFRIEEKDPYTHGHPRVAAYAVGIAQELGFILEEVQRIQARRLPARHREGPHGGSRPAKPGR